MAEGRFNSRIFSKDTHYFQSSQFGLQELPGRDGRELAHECKYKMHFGQFVVHEQKFVN